MIISLYQSCSHDQVYHGSAVNNLSINRSHNKIALNQSKPNMSSVCVSLWRAENNYVASQIWPVGTELFDIYCLESNLKSCQP